MDCSFILGSLAISEGILSVARRVMPDNRKFMDPIEFEALLFLSAIVEYWNNHTVKEAIRMNKTAVVQRRIEEDYMLEFDTR